MRKSVTYTRVTNRLQNFQRSTKPLPKLHKDSLEKKINARLKAKWGKTTL